MGEKRAAKSVAGSSIEVEEDRGWVQCGPRSTDSSWSYAPDGQGRYTTTMYFRRETLSLFRSTALHRVVAIFFTVRPLKGTGDEEEKGTGSMQQPLSITRTTAVCARTCTGGRDRKCQN